MVSQPFIMEMGSWVKEENLVWFPEGKALTTTQS